MKNEPYVIERSYNAPIAKVWKAITNNEDLKHWYFQLEDFKPEVGFEFRFSGGPDGRTYEHVCKVTEVVPGRKITYSWQYAGYEGKSYVTWELFDEGATTRLKLTHEGLETFPAGNADFARSNFEAGWTEITGKMLKEYVEKA